MKARLPKGMGGGAPGNMAGMLKQAQKMQEQITAKQEELNACEYTATAGGGMVTVVTEGKGKLKSIELKPEVVDPDDIEMLQDLIIAAVNEAISTAAQTEEEELEKITGGMSLPGLF